MKQHTNGSHGINQLCAVTEVKRMFNVCAPLRNKPFHLFSTHINISHLSITLLVVQSNTKYNEFYPILNDK